MNSKSFCYKHYAHVFLLLAWVVLLRLIFIQEKSLWLDECYTIIRSSADWSLFLSHVARNDSHPPLYYFVMKVWLEWLPSGELLLRLPSVIFSTLGMWYLYRTLRVFFTSSWASWATAIMATSSFVIEYAQEARHYSLSFFLGAWLTFCLVEMIYCARNRVLGYSFASVFALYTYYYNFFLLVVLGGIFVWQVWRKPVLFPVFRKWLWGQVAVAIAFFPWAYWVLPQKIALYNKYAALISSQAHLSLHALGQLLQEFLMGRSYGWVGYLVVFALVGQLLWLFFQRERSQTGGWLFLLLFSLVTSGGVLLVTWLLPFKGHVFESKHLIFIWPHIALVALCSVSPQKKWSWLLPGLICFLNLLSVVSYYPQQKQAWQQATSFVFQKIAKQEIVCFNPLYLKTPFAYYYAQHLKQAPAEVQSQKKFIPGYSLFSPELTVDPQNLAPGYFFLHEQDVQNTKRIGLWIIETLNSPVAPAHPYLHQWCQKFYRKGEQKFFAGLYGDIVVTHYIPKAHGKK